MPNGNGKRWIFGIIIGLFASAVTISGWVYNRGSKDQTVTDSVRRLEALEETVAEVPVYHSTIDDHDIELEKLNGDMGKLQEDVGAIKQDLREIGTDIKWIKENLQ